MRFQVNAACLQAASQWGSPPLGSAGRHLLLGLLRRSVLAWVSWEDRCWDASLCQGAGIRVQHSAQVVAGAIEVWAEAHSAVEFGHRVLHQVVALCGGTHAGQLLQHEAPVVESLQHSAASAGVLAGAT